MSTATQTTEKKARRSGKAKANAAAPNVETVGVLNADTRARVVMFYIPQSEQVDQGPIMRGHLEIDVEGEADPVKVNIAGWLKTGRESGKPYMSLKAGNNSEENPEVYTVGPFYGRMFKQEEEMPKGKKVRYFGFLEDSTKTGEDDQGHGIYTVNWQLRINAKPQVSGDGKTRYVAGAVMPNREAAVTDDLPF
jgi:hypothetical protein